MNNVNNKDLTPFFPVVLSSPGGDVEEAIAIAKTLRNTYKEVYVEEGRGNCTCACFILWASGVKRGWVEDMSKSPFNSTNYMDIEEETIERWDARRTNIGLHRPYLAKEKAKEITPNELDAKYKVVSEVVTNLLESWDIPKKYIDNMLSTSSIDIYWISKQELEEEIPDIQTAWEENIIARCNIRNCRIKSILLGGHCSSAAYENAVRDGTAKEIGNNRNWTQMPKYKKIIDCIESYRIYLDCQSMINMKKKYPKAIVAKGAQEFCNKIIKEQEK